MMRRIASAVFATALFVFMVSARSVPPPTDNTTAPDIFTANSQTGEIRLTTTPTDASRDPNTPLPTSTAEPTAWSPQPPATPRGLGSTGDTRPAQSLSELQRRVLELTNRERSKAGVPPVRMGNSHAPQLHADAALDGCYSGHWDRWGFKPIHRYTLMGGTGAGAENTLGLSYCYRSGDGYTPIDINGEIAAAIPVWMRSPGHRATLLNPAYRVMDVGVAYGRWGVMVVQFLSTDYVEYEAKPVLSSNGALTLKGRVKDATLTIGQYDNVQIAYNPPPRMLTTGQIASTYSLCLGRTVGSLLKPLSAYACYE